MKIIILHGDDTIKSYERLSKFMVEAKKRNWEVADYNLDSISNQSLFDGEKFYILKDYKILTKKHVQRLEKYAGNLIVYTAGLHPAVSLKMINPNKTEKFELPQKLWKFLDNMTIFGLHELIKTQPVEYILAMMAWKLKTKYRTNPTPGVGQMISELAEIDVKAKTGKANLKDSLDLLLIKRLAY